MKAIDLLTRALRAVGNVGSGETPTGDDIDAALACVNDMLDSWSTSKLFVYQLAEESFPLTTGKGTYLIGPGGDFITARPVSIVSAYVRMANSTSPIDYPLSPVDDDAYSGISMKTGFNGICEYIFYNPLMPAGEINLWPCPMAALTLFIQSPKALAKFPDLQTDLLLSPGYAEAIRYALMPRLAAEGLGKVSPEQIALAESAIERIKTVNSRVPVLRVTGDKRRFNIYGG